MKRAVENADLVREILRTLSRMRETPLIKAYWRIFSELAIELYGQTEMHVFAYTGSSELAKSVLGEARRGELREWLANYPQYAFSFVVGLAIDDENAAWGFAYG